MRTTVPTKTGRRSIMRIMPTPKALSNVLGIMTAAALAWQIAHAETVHAV